MLSTLRTWARQTSFESGSYRRETRCEPRHFEQACTAGRELSRGETGVVVFPLRLDGDRAAREADLTRSGLACASDCFLPIWRSASAESFAPYRVAGTMREFMDHIASYGRRIHGVD